MSVTLNRMTMLEVRETRWNEFLASLKPWELHLLTKDDQELILHDAYIAGETTIKQIRLDLSFRAEPISDGYGATGGMDPRD